MSLKHSSRSSTAAIAIHVGILQTEWTQIVSTCHVEYVDVASIKQQKYNTAIYKMGITLSSLG